MTKRKLFLIPLFLLCQMVCAQQDSILLKEVTVSDVQLRNFSASQQVAKFTDSVLSKNQPALTSLLNYNSVIYFKENGLGMVSSPSFRGTTAQQTAVIWNGININSQLNGQTDFNTVTTQDYQSVSVRSGGGSAIYGSSAIGGSIHLNNDIRFGREFSNQVDLRYGSFNTFQGNYKIAASDENVSMNVSVSRNSSDNDYEYLDSKKHQKNENGQYYNTSMSTAFGYKINASNYLKLYSQLFESERHFSGTTSSIGKSKYQDLNSRNMLEWVGIYSRFTSKLKVAALSERYKYFDNADAVFFNTSQAETFIARYDLGFNLGQKIFVNALADYTKTKGFGSDIAENTREIFAAAVLMKYQITRKIQYEISLRKEITENYKSPLLFASGVKVSFTKNYLLRFNVSRNFRIPTFNDLYWEGSGNPDLKPESSYQGEIGQELKLGSFVVSATGYYIDIKDMLRWIPGKNGVWSPQNVAKVKTYGVETSVNWQYKMGKHAFHVASNYGYVVSNDELLDKQLIYVPYHKAAASASYSYRKIGVWYQFLYNGDVYTSSDNFYKLNDYQVSNAGIEYNFGTKNTYKIGVAANNIANENYQNVSKRPMPGTNYTINLIFKF